MLKKLLRGCVRMIPREDGTVEIAGQAQYGTLFSGIPVGNQTREMFKKTADSQQRVRPQRDSVPLAHANGVRRKQEDCGRTNATERSEGGSSPTGFEPVFWP